MAQTADMPSYHQTRLDVVTALIGDGISYCRFARRGCVYVPMVQPCNSHCGIIQSSSTCPPLPVEILQVLKKPRHNQTKIKSEPTDQHHNVKAILIHSLIWLCFKLPCIIFYKNGWNPRLEKFYQSLWTFLSSLVHARIMDTYTHILVLL